MLRGSMVERYVYACKCGFESHRNYMGMDYILKEIVEKDEPCLYLPYEPIKNKGQFRKGNIPWNKGKNWDDMGISKEKQCILRENLEIGHRRGNPNFGGVNKKPVIAMDMYGERKHWFKSSIDAAKKFGLIARNIRRACVKGWYCGDFRWKFDERFN